MNASTIYEYIEFIVFTLYLIFIFLSIQVWLLWKDIDMDEWKLNPFVNASFFKMNLVYIFSASLFLIFHHIFEGISLSNSALFFEFFEALAVLSLVLFACSWYNKLKPSAHKICLMERMMKLKY